jgi:hypothetical protein
MGLMKDAYKVLVRTLDGRVHLEDPGIVGMITLD